MVSDDATDLRALVVSQYGDDIAHEAACLKTVRAALRTRWAATLAKLEHVVQQPSHHAPAKVESARRQLLGLQNMWNGAGFELEGADERAHCIELVRRRRAEGNTNG